MPPSLFAISTRSIRPSLILPTPHLLAGSSSLRRTPTHRTPASIASSKRLHNAIYHHRKGANHRLCSSSHASRAPIDASFHLPTHRAAKPRCHHADSFVPVGSAPRLRTRTEPACTACTAAILPTSTASSSPASASPTIPAASTAAFAPGVFLLSTESSAPRQSSTIPTHRSQPVRLQLPPQQGKGSLLLLLQLFHTQRLHLPLLPLRASGGSL